MPQEPHSRAYFVALAIPLSTFSLPAEYRAPGPQCKPVRFNATERAALARLAGMQYVAPIPMRHDGFALYAGSTGRFTVEKVATFNCDPRKEPADACRKRGWLRGFIALDCAGAGT